MKADSFLHTCFGYLTVKAVSVSHDASQDGKMGLIFPARVKLERLTLQIDGVQVRLSAGMSLSAEIKTGKRRVAIAYSALCSSTPPNRCVSVELFHSRLRCPEGAESDSR